MRKSMIDSFLLNCLINLITDDSVFYGHKFTPLPLPLSAGYWSSMHERPQKAWDHFQCHRYIAQMPV